MMALVPGTPCYLIGLVEASDLVGRVVEVVRKQEVNAYATRAEWADEMFGPEHVELLVQRQNLLPISDPAGPALAVTARGQARLRVVLSR